MHPGPPLAGSAPDTQGPLLILVLGMHRSGTSCLTRMLHQAGLFLGAPLMNDGVESNPEGHWENWEAVGINDRILELSGGTWDRVPASLHSDEATAARMRAFLAGLASHPVAGWKDPRTTLTFPAWKPLLGRYRLVACLRHPLAVARSLQARNEWTTEQGLQLWTTYNERLLQHTRSESAVCWFNFDLPEQELVASVRALCCQLGLRPTAAGLSFNPLLRHHAETGLPADPNVRALYEELLAELHGAATRGPSPT